MSTHGFDDDTPTDPSWFTPEAKMARGAPLSATEKRHMEEVARAAAWANPLKRYEILTARAAGLAASRQAAEAAVAERTAALAKVNADLAACAGELAATKAEVVELMKK